MLPLSDSVMLPLLCKKPQPHIPWTAAVRLIKFLRVCMLQCGMTVLLIREGGGDGAAIKILSSPLLMAWNKRFCEEDREERERRDLIVPALLQLHSLQ